MKGQILNIYPRNKLGFVACVIWSDEEKVRVVNLDNGEISEVPFASCDVPIIYDIFDTARNPEVRKLEPQMECGYNDTPYLPFLKPVTTEPKKSWWRRCFNNHETGGNVPKRPVVFNQTPPNPRWLEVIDKPLSLKASLKLPCGCDMTYCEASGWSAPCDC